MKKSLLVRSAVALSAATLIFAAGCSSKEENRGAADRVNETTPAPTTPVANTPSSSKQQEAVDEQPGTVYYEIFVRSFADSNGDGIGDLNGVISKLDYLQELGIEGIWLMPINPSPSYHGYDVTDYYDINPQYGTLEDMKKLLDEAHKRNIKVIMDLVVNHTSNKHPWFVDSAKGKDSAYRNWYTWAEDTGMKMPGDGATGSKPWHSHLGTHYLGIFWEGMPDLNFENPEVRKEMIKVGQFWLKLGLDGFRLDAAKHVYGDFRSSESAPATVEKNQTWWKAFRQGMNEVNKDAYIIGEVWDSPAIIAPYLDKFNSSFNFELAKKLIFAVNSEQKEDFAFFLNRIYGLYQKSSEGQFIDAPFLSNHDQNRVMTELQGNVDHAKMAAALLLTMPGNPFLYYGEEIGMKGAKPDEFIREPMLWNEGGKPGNGQTAWESSRFNQEKPPSVEAQLKDPDSLLNVYKKLMKWRKEEHALRDGAIQEYALSNPGVAAFVRATAKENALVVHNLTDKTQEIDLKENREKNAYSRIVRSSKDGAALKDNFLALPPYSSIVLK